MYYYIIYIWLYYTHYYITYIIILYKLLYFVLVFSSSIIGLLSSSNWCTCSWSINKVTPIIKLLLFSLRPLFKLAQINPQHTMECFTFCVNNAFKRYQKLKKSSPLFPQLSEVCQLPYYFILINILLYIVIVVQVSISNISYFRLLSCCQYTLSLFDVTSFNSSNITILNWIISLSVSYCQ